MTAGHDKGHNSRSGLTGGRKAVRGQDRAISSCREHPLRGIPPRGPLMLGMLLLRFSKSPNTSSAAAEACKAASSMLAQAWGEWGSREGPAAQ